MTGDDIRKAYLDFFAEKGHDIVPSSSLIPHGDPTLLLTSAGMVQFKAYYLGEEVPPNPRLASCQKCFRTTDIEVVGDTTHLTFFEMLGNFSIGDYFKKEAIAWGWEFCTGRLGLDPERLWATIYLDDEESFQYWREIGLPERKIRRFGDKENYWGPAGNSGPCGPCSEIHYDLGEELGCTRPTCGPNCDCGRFTEIWNLVFTQYNQDEAGNRTPLPRPNIDTGMGLERTLAVVTGKSSVYETDLFTPLLDCIGGLAGKKYGADETVDHAMRVAAEHGRGITFLIADGVVPANDGRGYVLRRLLRRASLFGRRLGLERPFLAALAQTTVDRMGHVYPELKERRDFIFQAIRLEETRFAETLNTGLEMLEGIMAGLGGRRREISGEQAFRLYDTYGFPVELTREVAAERGFSVDTEGFQREMARQKEKARASHRFELAEKGLSALKKELDLKTTRFVGYHRLTHKSAISALVVDNRSVKTAREGDEVDLVLESTPFYAEMGGQVGDTGRIDAVEGQFVVTDTARVPPDVFVHQGYVSRGEISVGDEVEASVDAERRRDIARNHTATHLLHYALRRTLGEHARQRGSVVAPDRFSFDFSHLTAMTPEELERVQRAVNEKIREDLPVYDEEMPYQEAVKEGAIALFDEKYGDKVRVLKTGKPPVSIELCGGTHAATTGEIGFFHILGEHSIGAGLRRIEAVTGRGAEDFIRRRFAVLRSIAGIVGAENEDVRAKVDGLVSELKSERRRRENLEKELARSRAETLLNRVESADGVNLLVAAVPSSRMEALREMSDFLRDKLKSVALVLGSVYQGKPVFLSAVTPDLVAKGYHAGNIIGRAAKAAGGGGGGRPDLAQAGGKHKDKLDEALRVARTLLEKKDA